MSTWRPDWAATNARARSIPLVTPAPLHHFPAQLTRDNQWRCRQQTVLHDALPHHGAVPGPGQLPRSPPVGRHLLIAVPLAHNTQY